MSVQVAFLQAEMDAGGINSENNTGAVIGPGWKIDQKPLKDSQFLFKVTDDD